MDSNIKLSNVIGAPFQDYVLKQMYLRAGHSSTTDRTLNDVLFIANKTAWARLVSSVNVIDKTILDLNKQPQDVLMKDVYTALGVRTYEKEESLAKNWILEAGTSVQSGNGIQLRSGIGANNDAALTGTVNTAYGLGGTTELGFVPMPGLTSVTVETLGRLGSLRQATINFRVNNLNQLNVIEALYFRLGYSMLLEWGHTQYFKNDGTFVTNEVYGIGDPFRAEIRKEDVIQEINIKTRETNGNYGGMYGVVTGFNWNATQDGGYDCTIKLIGHGAIMDSLKTNQSYTLPPGALAEYKNKNQIIAEFEQKLAQSIKNLNDRLSQSSGTGGTNVAPPVPPAATSIKNLFDIYVNQALGGDRTNWTDRRLLREYAWPLPDKYVYVPDNTFSKDNIFRLENRKNGGATEVDGEFIVWLDFSWIKDDPTRTYLERYYGGWYIQQKGNFIHIPLSVQSLTADFDLNELIQQGDGLYVQNYQNGAKYFQDQLTLTTLQSNNFSNQGNPLSRLILNESTVERVHTVVSPYANHSTTAPLSVQSFTSTGILGWPSTMDIDVDGIDSIYGNVGFLNLEITVTCDSDSWRPTANQISYYTDQLANKNPNGYKIPLTDITFSSKFHVGAYNKDLYVQGSYTLQIPDVGFTGDPTQETAARGARASTIGLDANGNTTATVKVTIKTDNISLFSDWTVDNVNLTKPAPPPPTPTPTPTLTPIQLGDTSQQDSPEGFSSALQAMLTVVQTDSQEAALGQSGVIVHDILEITKNFYAEGALSGVIDNTEANKTAIPNQKALDAGQFNLTNYALKGFNAALMANKSLYDSIPTINFQALAKSFIIKYQQGGIDGVVADTRSPTFISFGYLLAFLNNMCLIYDSNQSRAKAAASSNISKRPYVYIDFNPNTNFCFTNPQQFSIDPSICMIPMNCNKDEYGEIFPGGVNGTIVKKLDPKLFDPQANNVVTDKIDSNGFPYRVATTSNDSAYKGYLLNILLNTQYLLDLCSQMAQNDPEQAVNLKPFLDQILVDVNKSLGGVNSFRVSYIDDSNVIQIVDDQWVPTPTSFVNSPQAIAGSVKNPISQATVLDAVVQAANQKNNVEISGLLPLAGSIAGIPSANAPGQVLTVGSKSLTREFRFNTTISSKLASKIAISAQAETGSANSKDHSPYSHLNVFYEDRYSRVKDDSSKVTTVAGKQNKKLNPANKSSDEQAADLFNAHVSSLYSYFTKYAPANIQAAKNYYLDKMAKIKAGNPLTSASPYVSLELEMTVDGISGIIMLNAFTIPNSRLPYTYQGPNNTTKIAFIVTGLTHTISGNEWLTKIKGQMIKLKNPVTIATGVTQVPAGQVSLDTSNTAGVAKGGSYQGACSRQYDSKGKLIQKEYSGALQVPLGEAVTTQNVTSYVPGTKLIKGNSDIKLSNKGLAPLTEGEIVDDTRFNRFLFPKLSKQPDTFVIHQTDSMYDFGSNGSSVTNVTDPAQFNNHTGAQRQMWYFYCSGLPAQYIIDRQGVIHRFIPDGLTAWQAGNYNSHSIGVEIISNSDANVTDAQVAAAVRLAQYLGFSKAEVKGHGEIAPGHRSADEGRKVVNYIRNYL